MEKVVQVHTPVKPVAASAVAPGLPTEPPVKNPEILRPMTPKKKNKPTSMIIITLVVVLAGIGTGWVLAGNSAAKSGSNQKTVESDNVIQTDKEAGVADESEYGEPAEGTLLPGGLEGEGTHHLERPGGASQTVYLTSTVIDLASFENKKVQIWGQTFEGKKAGWFMDVVKVKVVD